MSGIFGPDRTDANYVLFPNREQAIQQSLDDLETAFFAEEPDPLSETRLDDLYGCLNDDGEGVAEFVGGPEQMIAFNNYVAGLPTEMQRAQRRALGLPDDG